MSYQLTDTDVEILRRMHALLSPTGIVFAGMSGSIGRDSLIIGPPHDSPGTMVIQQSGGLPAGNVTGPLTGGRYTLNLFTGAPSGNMSGNLTLPDSGETIGNTTVAWENVPENGLGTNWVGNGTKVTAFPTGGTLVMGNTTYPIYRGCVGQSYLFSVNLTQVSGSNGTSSTAASYTYSAINSVTSASISGGPFSVAGARTVGLVTAATKGFGYYNSTGTFILLWAIEPDQIATCSGGGGSSSSSSQSFMGL